MYSDDGVALVTYTYDAWGCVTAQAHGTSAAQIIAAIVALMFTPITYRGYNYDINTGLYYLQSRYYNPAYGRFLNADDTDILELTKGTIHGANLFAYCNNNPVMNVDYTGKLFGVDDFLVGLCFLLVVVGVILFVAFLSTIGDDVETRNEKMDTVLDQVEKIKELYDIAGDYWFAYYYHSKNVIECGTGVNPNPHFAFYEECKDFSMSYKESCLYTYRIITDYGAISKSERWSELDFDTKEKYIDLIMSVDFGLKHRIDKEFTAKLYNWSNEARLEIFKAVIDDLMPKF